MIENFSPRVMGNFGLGDDVPQSPHASAQAVAAPSDVELESFGIGGFTAYTPEVEVEAPVVAEAAPVLDAAPTATEAVGVGPCSRH